MTHQKKVLATNPHNPSSIPRTQVVKEEKELLRSLYRHVPFTQTHMQEIRIMQKKSEVRKVGSDWGKCSFLKNL